MSEKKRTGEVEGFRALLYNPMLKNEVVMLFSMLIPHLRDSFVIEEGDHSTFPDCFALRNGQKVGAPALFYRKS